MTLIIIACVAIGAVAVLVALYMTLKHKGDLDVMADFRRGKLNIKKKK